MVEVATAAACHKQKLQAHNAEAAEAATIVVPQNKHTHTLSHTHNQAVLPALAFCFSSRPSAAYTMAKAQGRAMNGAEKEREKGRERLREEQWGSGSSYRSLYF